MSNCLATITYRGIEVHIDHDHTYSPHDLVDTSDMVGAIKHFHGIRSYWTDMATGNEIFEQSDSEFPYLSDYVLKYWDEFLILHWDEWCRHCYYEYKYHDRVPQYDNQYDREVFADSWSEVDCTNDDYWEFMLACLRKEEWILHTTMANNSYAMVVGIDCKDATEEQVRNAHKRIDWFVEAYEQWQQGNVFYYTWDAPDAEVIASGGWITDYADWEPIMFQAKSEIDYYLDQKKSA